MNPEPPPGQGPIDPRGAFAPPAPPAQAGSGAPPPGGTWNPPPGGFGPPPMPPPGYFPPPMMYPPPQPQRSFARGIFLTLATTIFGLSLLLNLYLLVMMAMLTGDSSTRQTVIIPGDSKQKIAVISVEGLLVDEAVARFNSVLRMAEADRSVKGVVLEINTAGGTVAASDQMLRRIHELKDKRQDIVVVVSMGGVAASGGYYVSCGADYIFAQPTTWTGNIGVLLPRLNVHRLIDKWGIEEVSIIASGADFKNAGSSLKPETEEARQYIQELVDKAYERFKDTVRDGRSLTQEEVDLIANGKIFTADDALELKLIDEIGYPSDAYDYIALQQGLSRPQIVRYHERAGLLVQLLSRSNTGNVTIQGINIDGNGLQELLTPRLMYLWRGD